MPQVTQGQMERQIVAGDAAVLARRYAGALYDLALEQKQMDVVATDLRMLRSLLQDSPEFRALATQPRLKRTQLVTAMQNIGKAASFNALTIKFLALVAQNRRLSVLGAVIEAFLEELAASRGEFTADVRTARALSPAQQDQLAVKLRDMAGGKVHLHVREDASLLGGLTVKLGSRLIDASLKSKLERLHRQLTSPSSAMQKGAA